MNFQEFSAFTYMDVVKMGFWALSRLEIYISQHNKQNYINIKI